jgi:hypothetical protein
MKQTRTNIKLDPAGCAAMIFILLLLGILGSGAIWIIVQIWESM